MGFKQLHNLIYGYIKAGMIAISFVNLIKAQLPTLEFKNWNISV